MQDEELEPKLLTKDQLVEATFYVAGGAVVAIPGAFVAAGVFGAVVVGFSILALLLGFILAVNAVRRWRWRRRRRSHPDAVA